MYEYFGGISFACLTEAWWAKRCELARIQSYSWLPLRDLHANGMSGSAAAFDFLNGVRAIHDS